MGQVWPYYDPHCKKCRSLLSSQRRRDIKVKAIQYMGGRCSRCKNNYSPCVYDFHHLDPTKKDFTIGSQAKAFASIKEELDKCVLLCSNCHRETHYALNLPV